MDIPCLPGIFAEERIAKFDPYRGNGVIIPNACAENIIKETDTELLVVFSMAIYGEMHYMTLAGYCQDEYAYIPGSLLGDDFNPGELITLDIVKNVGHTGTLYLDCEWFDNAKEILERCLGDIYRVVYPGMVIKTDDGHEYRVKKISNSRGVDIPVGLAIDTDMEIIFNEPDVHATSDVDTVSEMEDESPYDTESCSSNDDLPEPVDHTDPPIEEERKPTLAELRAMRLAYFDKTR